MTPTTRCLIAALALLGLSACETVKGAGQDIQATGEAISDTAQDASS